LGSGKPEVFNTDQGVQFTAEAFTGRLEGAGVAVRASAHFYNDLVDFAALRPPDRPAIPVTVS
jgi:hypothetical protein